MRWMVLAVFGASLMMNGQEARDHSSTERGHSAAKSADRSKDASDVTGQTVIVVNQQVPVRRENENPRKSPGYFHELLVPANIPNLLLVGVGIAGIVVALRTLSSVKSQANIMRSQLDAMNGQISQMENAGRQTAELVRHAEGQVAALSNSAKAAKETAEAARHSASAARDSVEIVISKGRARLTVEPQPLEIPSTESEISMFNVCYTINHKGTTDAKIVRSRTFVSMSDFPYTPPEEDGWDLSAPRWFSSEDSDRRNHHLITLGRRGRRNITLQDIEGLRTGAKFIHFWGSIEYEDIFGRSHTNRFKWRCGMNAFYARPIWTKYGDPEDNSEK